MTVGDPLRDDGDGSSAAPHWSDTLSYRGGSGDLDPSSDDTGSEHWHGWHYGIYVAALLLTVGVVQNSLALLVAGYLLVPIFVHFDSRYVESVTPGWQRDIGLYVLGSILAPFLLIPAYLYRRRELRR